MVWEQGRWPSSSKGRRLTLSGSMRPRLVGELLGVSLGTQLPERISFLVKQEASSFCWPCHSTKVTDCHALSSTAYSTWDLRSGPCRRPALGHSGLQLQVHLEMKKGARGKADTRPELEGGKGISVSLHSPHPPKPHTQLRPTQKLKIGAGGEWRGDMEGTALKKSRFLTRGVGKGPSLPSIGKVVDCVTCEPSAAPLIWAFVFVKLTKGNCPHTGPTVTSDSCWGWSGVGPFQVLALCSPGTPSPPSSAP